jgi:hypothetical protein
MTEYIIIVGLVACGVIGAVVKYKEQIQITIEGSDGPGGGTPGMTKEVKKMGAGIGGSASSKGAKPTTPGAFMGQAKDGWRWDGSAWV